MQWKGQLSSFQAKVVSLLKVWNMFKAIWMTQSSWKADTHKTQRLDSFINIGMQQYLSQVQGWVIQMMTFKTSKTRVLPKANEFWDDRDEHWWQRKKD